MDGLELLLKLAGAWIAASYVIGPFVVRATLRVPERYLLPRLDWSEFVATSGPIVAARHHELVALGFVPAVATAVPNVKAALYVHPNDGAGAQLRHARKFVSVCFVQQYVGGAKLLVGSAPLPGIYPHWDKRLGYNFPSRLDVTTLYSKFTTIRSRVALGERIAAAAPEALHAEEDFLNAELRELVQAEFYSHDASNGKRHVTLKGACLMTWKLAWPSKPLLIFAAHRRAERAAA